MTVRWGRGSAPMALLPLIIAALAWRLATPAHAAEAPPEYQRWRAHLEMLASDAMRGRQTGSPEHAKAAAYVAEQFRSIGLKPAAGHGSFVQPVRFVWRKVREDACAVSLVSGEKREDLQLGRDATLSMAIDEPDSLAAPLAFVGYGLSVPENGYDDLANVDLHDKVAVYIQGAPASVPEPRRSHAQSGSERWAAMHAKGAIGLIGIRNPKRAEATWERGAAQRFSPGMSLADSAIDEHQGQRLSLTVNDATAQKWFEGSGHAFADLIAAADSGGALPTFDLPQRVRVHAAYERHEVTSQNVVALLPGSDPTLAKQYVVLTAHLDHLGVGAPVAGDSIYNGAMDNASGVSALIEVARGLAQHRPRRSVLFVIVTGEEKGLLGSYYWTKHPTVLMSQVVADLNTDMVLPIVPFDHVVIQGVNESTLGDTARAEAEASGILVIPDPEPQRNRFIRSDQFSFIRAGIPALAFNAAAPAGSPGDSLLHAWVHDHYHQPSDDLAQPLDPSAPVALIHYVTHLATAVANAPDRPQWKETSFFRRFQANRQ